MTTRQIDILNIGLMLVSCLLAFVIPFELFLFSYAILGPLHYLTEITWLHKRDYFTNSRFDFIWLSILGLFVTLLAIVFTDYNEWSTTLIYIAFLSALAMVVFKDFLYKTLFIAGAIILGLLIRNTAPFFFLFAVFLPTLIHVFLFTGLFIISGALKSKSATGLASIIVFVGCAISFFFIYPHFSFYQVSEYAEKNLTATGFSQVNTAIIHLFKLGESSRDNVFKSDIGFGIMRFIAFAYTYHYLNWFSKTSVIKWHLVPRKWLITVIALWIASVALYAYDYYTGLLVLYFLSMLHVFFEFPLNYRSVIQIGDSLKTLRPLKAAKA
jgi:hypothetical protein